MGIYWLECKRKKCMHASPDTHPDPLKGGWRCHHRSPDGLHFIWCLTCRVDKNVHVRTQIPTTVILNSSVRVGLLLVALFPPTGGCLCLRCSPSAWICHCLRPRKSLLVIPSCRLLSPTFPQVQVRPARRTRVPTWACASSSGRTSHATAPWHPTPGRTATTVSTANFLPRNGQPRHRQAPAILVALWGLSQSLAPKHRHQSKCFLLPL